MASKLRGAGGAVTGYWGNNPYRRIIDAERTPQKIRVLLQDKLRGLGKLAWLYLPVTSTTSGVVACTCVRDSTQQADQPCFTCYGTHYAPGYLRFGSTTLFWASAEAAGFTLAGCALDTTIKPNRVLLNTGATTGTITTTDKAFSNPDAVAWALNTDEMLRATGNTVVVQFSIDAGTNWRASSDINNAIVGLVGTGNVRLRITLTRSAAADKSSAWEITRLRRVRDEHVNRMLLKRPSYLAGQILLLRTWAIEQVGLDAGAGRQVGQMADRGWTAPLDFFDTSLTMDTPSVKIDDRDPGPHPFYEIAYGIHSGDRYAITGLSFNEQFGLFTHQSWGDRLVQRGESYHLVY